MYQTTHSKYFESFNETISNELKIDFSKLNRNNININDRNNLVNRINNIFIHNLNNEGDNLLNLFMNYLYQNINQDNIHQQLNNLINNNRNILNDNNIRNYIVNFLMYWIKKMIDINLISYFIIEFIISKN